LLKSTTNYFIIYFDDVLSEVVELRDGIVLGIFFILPFPEIVVNRENHSCVTNEYITAGVPVTWWSRLQKSFVDTYHELLADFTEEPIDVEGRDPDGDQLAVKQSVIVFFSLSISLISLD